MANARFAYVTLVMKGDDYVCGAVALAKSLRYTKCCIRGAELVCMVTKDVSRLEELRNVFDKVTLVDYISYQCGSMMTKRQNDLYGSWINDSFTKWQCFNLTQYSKIVYLDADQVVVQNLDHLFDMETPAMCFRSEFENYYKRFRHGDRIPLKYCFENVKLLGCTGTLVLTPSRYLLDTIKTCINLSLKQTNTFHNGFEEVVFAMALIKLNINPVQLSHLYVWNAGSYKCLNKSQPYIINFYGTEKPWNSGESVMYMDQYIWKYFASL
ncbi:p13 [Spodoptera litura granulovirus]|uniref:P13 n=1 Tax=Spodoptera litura granulovirus TaxID=359919 RepID=A5IZP0_9BBAC|nr:p13 [Spodoptera litura granulovirus]ABQ51981.1 p13 [Spodoptera litura granulovirus]